MTATTQPKITQTKQRRSRCSFSDLIFCEIIMFVQQKLKKRINLKISQSPITYRKLNICPLIYIQYNGFLRYKIYKQDLYEYKLLFNLCCVCKNRVVCFVCCSVIFCGELICLQFVSSTVISCLVKYGQQGSIGLSCRVGPGQTWLLFIDIKCIVLITSHNQFKNVEWL